MAMPLRPNLTHGKFDDLEDYLSTNFCLLREDYVRDFKDGINEFKRNVSTKTRLVNINIHAEIHEMFMSRDMIGLNLKILMYDN